MKKIIIPGLIFIIFFTGCSGKKYNPKNTGRFEGAFAYEKRVLLDMIDVLKRYNARVLQASTTEEIIKANEELSDKLEILNPEIIFVTEKHPEWAKNPPEELKTLINEYMYVNREFGTFSLDIVKNKIKSHPEDDELLRSFERLKYITTPEDKKEEDAPQKEEGVLNENEENTLW